MTAQVFQYHYSDEQRARLHNRRVLAHSVYAEDLCKIGLADDDVIVVDGQGRISRRIQGKEVSPC